MVDEPHFPNKRLTELMDITFKRAVELRTKKGAEYAGTHIDDVLANFRRNGKDAGVSMEVCWRIYAGKHWDAISQYVRDIDNNYFTRERMEPIEGRIDDLIVYLILFQAMIIERMETTNPKVLVTGNLVEELNVSEDPNPWVKRNFTNTNPGDIKNV